MHPERPTTAADIKLSLPPKAAARLARAWRIAAETSRQQYPNDEARYRYYMDRAEQLESQS